MRRSLRAAGRAGAGLVAAVLILPWIGAAAASASPSQGTPSQGTPSQGTPSQGTPSQASSSPAGTAAPYDAAADGYSMYDVTLGSGAQAYWQAGYTGQGVGVALVDSGVSPVEGLTTSLGPAPAAATPPTVTNLAVLGASLNHPSGVAVDARGDLFVADTGHSVVREVTTAGTVSVVAGTGHNGFSGDGGPATAAQLNQPSAVAVDTHGDVFIADTGNSVVREVDAAGTISTVAGRAPGAPPAPKGIPGTVQLNHPGGVAVDARGDLFIADTGSSLVRELAAGGTTPSVVAGTGHNGFSGDGGPATAAQLNQPGGVAVDASGNLYIADTGNSAVREVDNASQAITTLAGTGHDGYSGDGGPATAAQLNHPGGVALDPGGNVYVADTGNSAVRQISAATGRISTIAGGPAAPAGSPLNHPADLAVDAQGDVYLAGPATNSVQEIAAAPVQAAASGSTPNVVYGPDLSFDSQSSSLTDVDSFGHGTHMAGIIAGHDPGAVPGHYAGDSADFLGMAPDAHIVSVKVADTYGDTDVTQLIAAIDWVVQHRNDPGMNIRVLNLSVGTDPSQPYQVDPLAYAAEQAWDHGIVVVVAAGNDGTGNAKGPGSGLEDPAYDPNLLAVGAADTHGTPGTTADDTVAGFSANQGAGATYGSRRPDLVAPGTHVQSLRDPGSWIDTNYASTGAIDDRFFRGSGTSQAAAVVSGAAALVISQHPGATPDQVKALLMQSADVLPKVPAGDQGSGELDLTKALSRPLPGGAPTSPPSTGTGPLQGSRGDDVLVDPSGAPLTGNTDIFGAPVDTAALARLEAAASAWTGGSFNGNQWTGSGWATSSLLGHTWSGHTWSAADWAGHTWSDADWAGHTWSGHTWSGNTWSGHTWSGNTWSGNTWSGNTWSDGGWDAAGWR